MQIKKLDWRPGQPWRKSQAAPLPTRPAPEVVWTTRDTCLTWSLFGFLWFAAWIVAGVYLNFNPFPIMTVIHLIGACTFLILAAANLGRLR